MKTMGEKAEEALRAVREAPKIAYDTETTGLDWRYNQPVGYVITASAQDNWYIPVRHGGGANLLDPNVPPLLTGLEESPDHAFEVELAKAFAIRREKGFLTVGHHLKFDMHMSAKHGIYLGRNCGDTGINEPMLDEFSFSYNLENCAKKHGVTAKRGQEMYEHLAAKFGGKADHKQMEHFWKLAGNDEVAIDYACGDGISTLELWDAQMKQIVEQEMQVIHDVESRLIWTVFRIEHRGIRADADRIEAVKTEVKNRLRTAERTLPDRFNVRSGPQVKALMEESGFTDWPTTAIGNPSFPESWLKKNPVGKNIVEVRKLTNLLNSFVTPLDRHIYKGRVHSSLNQLKSDDFGTISGRFSSSEPNMQQIPKRDKDLGRLFRSIFLPDDGYEFYEADYSQCEPRLFAHYSKEKSLVEAYSAVPSRDMHHVVAEMFVVERDPTAKRMNMGILTGMQPRTFASHMGWDLEHATAMFNQWFQVFPGIKEFQKLAKTVFRSRRFVKTLLGRRCRLDSDQFAYRATSRIIQGGNADIIKYMLLKIDEFLEANGDVVHLLMTVHDSINWQAPATEEGRRISDEIVKIALAVQCEPFNLRVPFAMDVGRGPSWAIATYGELKDAA